MSLPLAISACTIIHSINHYPRGNGKSVVAKLQREYYKKLMAEQAKKTCRPNLIILDEL